MHGFIPLNEWEWEIINHYAFQRLRRIRQLGFTDYIYPGATHTRFEHSLGVMHIATRLYDGIVQRSRDLLEEEFEYNEDGLRRDRQVVRLASLLHDLGHAPFSHATEGMFPAQPGGKVYTHEQYTAEIIRSMYDVIENHLYNRANYDIKAETIANFFDENEISQGKEKYLFWKHIISGQMDADRMDYLLRDSHHLGVRYGVFDLERVINTICAVRGGDQNLTIGIHEDGYHAVEGLILARYYMFTQVYFHKTRVAYDHHIQEAIRAILNAQGFHTYPPPNKIKDYLEWDDWKVLGAIHAGDGGEHGLRIRDRNHHRKVFESRELPAEQGLYNSVKQALGEMIAYEAKASKLWYTTEKGDIMVASAYGRVRSFSEISMPVAGIMSAYATRYLYVRPEDKEEAMRKIKGTIQ